jgi:Putative peptidoglycan binding domain
MVWKGDAENRLAKSLITLIDEVDQKFPSRDRHNDGTIGDVRHQQEGSTSDHNPNIRDGSMGVVTALDVTHDPAAGFDAGAFAESLRQAKDNRIKYVIFNGRIFNSTVSPWVWRDRNQGPGDHSEHVHVSVVADPTRFDDTRPWPFDSSGAMPGQVTVFRPKLKLGDSGPAVADLQRLLGIGADGEFGPDTDRAVRDFQASRGLFVDGIVGSHTWGALTAASTDVAGGGDVGNFSIKLAGGNPLQRLGALLMMFSKDKPGAADPAQPRQDLGKVLLPLLQQSMTTGKQTDVTQLLLALLAGNPSASQAPASSQPTDLNALLLLLLSQLSSGKPLGGLTPAASATPPIASPTPAVQKPSVQLSMAALAVSAILQVLGVVGTPFGLGAIPTTVGTLATLVPILTGAFGATGGFGALLNVGRALLRK